MEEMNDRVKKLRKNILKMSMEAFGKKIGLSKAGISSFEAGKNGISEMAILAICREYGVREEWLRDGTGDIFVQKSAEEELNTLADKIMTDTPESFRRRFVSMLAKLTDEQWKVLSDMEDMLLAMRTDQNMQEQDEQVTEQSLHADLQKEIDAQKKAEERSTGSGSIAG